MRLEFYDGLYRQLEADIRGTMLMEKEPLRKITAVLKVILHSLDKLRTDVAAHPFGDKEEEIHFFKQVKPRFYAQKLFYIRRFFFESNVPAGDAGVRKQFCREELRLLQRKLQQLAFYHQYYRMQATELDELYFLRGADRPVIWVPEAPEPDPLFSTTGDYVFAKVRAYELMQAHLIGCLADEPGATVGDSVGELPELRWTGDKINLVEVIYALYFTGQLNNGNAGLSQIIAFMERHLQIDLSRTYRDFIDIRNRKVSSPTRFIEQMRESIHKRIDDELAFKPAKNRSQLP